MPPAIYFLFYKMILRRIPINPWFSHKGEPNTICVIVCSIKIIG